VALRFGVLTVPLILPRAGVISRRLGLPLLATSAVVYLAVTLAL
jgi:hypothetical protein